MVVGTQGRLFAQIPMLTDGVLCADYGGGLFAPTDYGSSGYDDPSSTPFSPRPDNADASADDADDIATPEGAFSPWRFCSGTPVTCYKRLVLIVHVRVDAESSVHSCARICHLMFAASSAVLIQLVWPAGSTQGAPVREPIPDTGNSGNDILGALLPFQ